MRQFFSMTPRITYFEKWEFWGILEMLLPHVTEKKVPMSLFFLIILPFLILPPLFWGFLLILLF